MKKWAIWFVCLTAVSVILAGWISNTKQERVPDETRIRQLLVDGQQAVVARDLRGAMVCISRGYRDPNDLTYDTLKTRAAHAMRSVSAYDLRLDAPDIEFKDATKAIARTHVAVVAYFGGMPSPPIDFEATIKLTKEDSRRWWIFPASQWRITSLQNLPLPELHSIME